MKNKQPVSIHSYAGSVGTYQILLFSINYENNGQYRIVSYRLDIKLSSRIDAVSNVGFTLYYI